MTQMAMVQNPTYVILFIKTIYILLFILLYIEFEYGSYVKRVVIFVSLKFNVCSIFLLSGVLIHSIQ